MQPHPVSKLLIPTLLGGLSTLAACAPPTAPTGDELVAQFPSVGANSARPENVRVLCPFQRMLERAGIYDEELSTSDTVTVGTVTDASEVFGCARGSCGPVATQVSVGQGHRGEIDLEALNHADGISHECGLTFDYGGAQVSDAARDATLARLTELADGDGHLAFAALRAVKEEICAAQGVEMTSAGEIEIRLIYAYLGGVEHGFISLSDVGRFLHATMPETKTDQWVNSALLSQVQ